MIAFVLRAIRRALPWLAAIVIAGSQPAAAAQSLSESEVKAAALYNILQFTDWPAKSFAGPESPLIIGVLGQGPVADILGSLVATETWRGRRVILQPLKSVTDARTCHVVYLGLSAHRLWPALRSQLTGAAVLTVCGMENFARDGGTVELTLTRNKLRLAINLRAVRAGGLTISSNVLRLAEVVDQASE